MSIAQSLLPELDLELANSRKTLERVPAEKFDWTPHPKSMTMAQLASHLAEIPSYGSAALETESLDLSPPGAPAYKPRIAGSREEVLQIHDEAAAKFRSLLEKATDEQLHAPWSLLFRGQTIFTMPRVAVIRSMVMNHLIHHRGQLTVYLRLNDVPVPALYGPSADEGQM